MTRRMLVDATHPEETRVAIVESYRDNNRLDDFDFVLASKPILRGNIYLAKVMRIEPSLQAAFVEYGGNRHGFLPFSEIHPDYFRIPMSDRPADEPVEDAAESKEAPAEAKDSVPEEEFSLDAAPIDTPDSEKNEAGFETETQPIASPEEIKAPEFQPPIDTFMPLDTESGLIMDFGNAAVSSPSTDMPIPEPALVESVGGDTAEQFVRHHRPRYKIQEVLKRGQVMLVQVVKEERGNKGAALTTFLSLAGRYCVLMPNTDHGGGVSRKITNHQDRRRLKEILDQLEIPEGMAVILRTAGMEQDPPEIQRDLEYLLRLWNSIREQTLQSTAPSLIYEEANLIKRSVRDLYAQNIDEILVAGAEGYEKAREFMRTIMPDAVEKIRLYNDPIPLFFRYHVENQIDSLHSATVQLRSGGYLVINPTEALVSIDVNSGRATRERHIEETAVKTNLEAADEIARQLRLRDLAGLVVIDFIDMEDNRNNAAVERRLKEAMKNDRARLQIGHISLFGLLELSRQRLRPSLLEINFEKCPHCAGSGYIRSVDSAALSILRLIEEEGIKQRSSELILHVPTRIALYILNQKRASLTAIEQRYDLHVLLHSDDTLVAPDYRIERLRNRKESRLSGPAVNTDEVLAETERALPPFSAESDQSPNENTGDTDLSEPNEERGTGRRRFRQRGGQQGRRDKNRRFRKSFDEAPLKDQPTVSAESCEQETTENEPNFNVTQDENRPDDNDNQRRRRRGRRGGRRHNGRNDQGESHGEGRGEKRRWNRGSSDQQSTMADAPLPTSIHEIDTTPRPVSEDPAPSRNHSSSPQEIVDTLPGKPKAGWWKKLTGQE